MVEADGKPLDAPRITALTGEAMVVAESHMLQVDPPDLGIDRAGGRRVPFDARRALRT